MVGDHTGGCEQVCLSAKSILFLLHTHHAEASFPLETKKISTHLQNNSAGLVRATYSNNFLLKETHQQPRGKWKLVESCVSVVVFTVLLLAHARVMCCLLFKWHQVTNPRCGREFGGMRAFTAENDSCVVTSHGLHHFWLQPGVLSLFALFILRSAVLLVSNLLFYP